MGNNQRNNKENPLFSWILTLIIVEPAMVGPYKGGIPEVSGSAYVTGLLKLVIDPADPLRHGFRLA